MCSNTRGKLALEEAGPTLLAPAPGPLTPHSFIHSLQLLAVCRGSSG